MSPTPMPEPAHGPPGPTHLESTPVPGHPPEWGEALRSYVLARKELLAIEAKEATAQTVKKGVLAGIAAAFGAFAYVLLLAGAIGFFAARSETLGWDVLALIAAGGHLAIAFVSFLMMRRPTASAFSLTRKELEKDLLWLRDLKERARKP